MVEYQDVTDTRLENLEIELASLYGYVQPWIKMILENIDIILYSTLLAKLLEFTAKLNAHISSFERLVSARFIFIEVPNLERIKKDVSTLREKVCSLTNI